MDRRNFIITAASAAMLIPATAVASPAPVAEHVIGGPDAPILAAWRRRVEAFAIINSERAGDDEACAPYWVTVEECDRLIQSSTASTPRGVEVQIWTALHNSSAYVRSEEEAILRMDLDYVSANAREFEWDAQPMLAAIRSLRAMDERLQASTYSVGGA